MAAWRNFAWRSSAAAFAADPQDANNITTPIYAANDPLYTANVLSADGVNKYGRYGSSGVFGDLASANAGANPLLGGRVGITSAWAEQIDAQPGDYELRIALGAGTSTSIRNACVIFDGSRAYVDSFMSASPNIWNATTAVSLNSFMVSKADKSIWKCVTAGTTGTVQPTGAIGAANFTDGTVVWQRMGINAMHIVDNSVGTSTSVIDQNSVVVASSAWDASTPISITLTGGVRGNALTIYRAITTVTYFRAVSIRLKAPTLTSIVMKDETLTSVGSNPACYAGQPSDILLWRIETTQGAANFTLTGELAPYFKVVTYNGFPWIATNGTRIPAGFGGTIKTLRVTQNDPEATPTSYNNDFNVSVLSSQGRPLDNSILGNCLTQTWINRKTVKDKIDTIWAGYTGQTIAAGDEYICDNATDVANAISSITTKVNAGGINKWYSIRPRGNIPFTNPSTLITFQLNMGPNGGLLIKPLAGHDPEWHISLSNGANIHGLHVDGLNSPGISALGNPASGGFQWRFGDPGPTGINGSGKFNRVKFTNCRHGSYFANGYSIPSAGNVTDPSGWFLFMTHGESLEISNCKFFAGCGNKFAGVRYCKIEGNEAQLMSSDLFDPAHYYTVGSTRNVTAFGDEKIYVWIANNVWRNENDWVGRDNGLHCDFVQLQTPFLNMSFWFPNAGENNATAVTQNNPDPGWDVGDYCLKQGEGGPALFGRIYQVASRSGGVTSFTGATGPTGTTNGQVDGQVTWNYVADWDGKIPMYLHMEDNTIQSTMVNGTRSGVQFLIDSSGGFGNLVHCSAVNNSWGGDAANGIYLSEGTLNAENNTFVFPARSYDWASGGFLVDGQIRINSGVGHARRNVVCNTSSASSGAGIMYVYEEKTVEFQVGSAIAGVDRPQDVMIGPFVQNGKTQNTFEYQSLVYTGVPTTAAFVSQQRAVLLSKTAWVGARRFKTTDVVIPRGGSATITKEQAATLRALTVEKNPVVKGTVGTARWASGTKGFDIKATVT